MKNNLFFLLMLFGEILLAGTDYTLTMSYQNTNRDFIVYLPNGYAQGAHLPVVFNLHGYTSNASQQIFYSKMYLTADSNNFIMVAPNGLNNSWNAGFAPPYNSFPDDVGFISKIIDTLYQLYTIDLTRVYACGMSNGGFLSYRLACDLENRIAAVASVTGSISTLTATNCMLARKVPVLQIHGTADPLVDYHGATGYYGIEQLIDFWRAKNQCTQTNDTVFVADINTTDSSTVQQIRYRSCDNGTEVWLYKVIGGGHSWPQAPIEYIYGPTNKDMDASQEIWDFFKKFTLNGPARIAQNTPPVSMTIFPNPAANFLAIECSAEIKRIEIWNTIGEKLQELNNRTTWQIPLAEIPAGIYLLKAEGNNFTATKRFIKE